MMTTRFQVIHGRPADPLKEFPMFNTNTMFGKQIPNFPYFYVTSDGFVYREVSDSKMIPVATVYPKSGYASVNLYDRDGKRKFVGIHCLILQAFVGPRPPNNVCRHLDGDKNNNNLSNLAWGTYKDNTQDAIRHGTFSMGEKHRSAILTYNTVTEVKKMYAAGVMQSHIAREFGVSSKCIWGIVNGVTWKSHKMPEVA